MDEERKKGKQPPTLGRFLIRKFSLGTADRLSILAKQTGYGSREPFTRAILERVSLMSPEQIKQFFDLPLFL